MNYFAHGRDAIDSPERLAGTALPDWLAAADRRTRLRRDRLDGSDLAAGVRLHYDDDRWFHAAEAFQRCCDEVTERISALPDYHRDMRAWFLGHVLVEMLLDRFLIRENPARLDAYYDALDAVDTNRLLGRVQSWLTRESPRLPRYIEAFKQHRFLYGYLDDNGLFARLCGVARRVRLPRLPRGLRTILPDAARIVERRVPDLMRPPC